MSQVPHEIEVLCTVAPSGIGQIRCAGAFMERGSLHGRVMEDFVLEHVIKGDSVLMDTIREKGFWWYVQNMRTLIVTLTVEDLREDPLVLSWEPGLFCYRTQGSTWGVSIHPVFVGSAVFWTPRVSLFNGVDFGLLVGLGGEQDEHRVQRYSTPSRALGNVVMRLRGLGGLIRHLGPEPSGEPSPSLWEHLDAV